MVLCDHSVNSGISKIDMRVSDRHSGPGERLLYPKFQTDTLGYSAADRSFCLRHIFVDTLGDRLLCPGLITD